jgi:predicted O-methyltransferase YrrM
MAISFEASQFVFALAKIRKTTRVADLGSGFSSYILRQYASTAGENVVVYSVDDDLQWLQKTRDFLERMSVSSENVMSWEDFKEQELDPFDLIFHDLGHTDGLRIESLPHIIGLLKPSGILILDDMHKGRGGLIGGYRAKATDLVKQAGLSLFSARKFTLDKYGRFCEVALPTPVEHRSER